MLRGPTTFNNSCGYAGMERVFHRVQVIQVAEEFVEPVERGQELVFVTEVVLAKLARGVAQRFERGGHACRLVLAYR